MKPHRLQNRLALVAGISVMGLFGITIYASRVTASIQPVTEPVWVLTGNLNNDRANHTATLLPNGKVLVAGGESDGGQYILNSAELYDPATGTWSLTGRLNAPRFLATATLLPNGKVLVAGGITTPSSVTATAELYDPATGTWSLTGNLNTTRFWHSATLLRSGKVLIAGGHGGQDGARPTAELYDPASGTWSVTGNLLNAGRAGRMSHSATMLLNGNVLVAGGNDGDEEEVPFSSAELYNPGTETWSVTGSFITQRGLHTATLLQNGKVLVAGDRGSAELYEPTPGTWSLTGPQNTTRWLHSASLLGSGKVLIAGGFGQEGRPSNTAEVYDPTSGTWSNTASLHTARRSHTATPLQNGKVLIAGGFKSTGGTLNSAELYDPGAGPNQIDAADFFVRQHYLDFLSREPDAPGWAHWTGEITECDDSAKRFPGESPGQCVDRKRTNTSGAFFLSNELQNSASFLLRVNWGSLGKLPNTQCIVGIHSSLNALCRPLYSQYVADITKLTQGIVVNNQLNPDAMNANRRAFATDFVARAEFQAVYGGLSDAAYVDKLVQTTGVPLTAQERQELITEAGTGGGRASVLYKVVDGTTTIAEGHLRFDTRYGKAFYDQEFDTAFVFMQYLGYLRRNPDQAGYDHWLAKLRLYGNFVDAEMVRSFLVSDEYRNRF